MCSHCALEGQSRRGRQRLMGQAKQQVGPVWLSSGMAAVPLDRHSLALPCTTCARLGGTAQHRTAQSNPLNHLGELRTAPK